LDGYQDINNQEVRTSLNEEEDLENEGKSNYEPVT